MTFSELISGMVKRNDAKVVAGGSVSLPADTDDESALSFALELDQSLQATGQGRVYDVRESFDSFGDRDAVVIDVVRTRRW